MQGAVLTDLEHLGRHVGEQHAVEFWITMRELGLQRYVEPAWRTCPACHDIHDMTPRTVIGRVPIIACPNLKTRGLLYSGLV